MPGVLWGNLGERSVPRSKFSSDVMRHCDVTPGLSRRRARLSCGFAPFPYGSSAGSLYWRSGGGGRKAAGAAPPPPGRTWKGLPCPPLVQSPGQAPL